MSAAPDYLEPLLGWRACLVVEDAGALRLRSATPAAQRCPVHAAPCVECKCGIYGASEPETVASYLDSFTRPEGSVVDRVLGRVCLWGRVLECERGWRASRAYPARLYVPARRVARARLPVREVALALAGDYGVPVELVPCRTAADLSGLVSRGERASTRA